MARIANKFFFIIFQKFWALIKDSGVFIIHLDATKQRNGTAGVSLKRGAWWLGWGGPRERYWEETAQTLEGSLASPASGPFMTTLTGIC